MLFWNADDGIIAQTTFPVNVALIYRTTDGGKIWTEASLQLPPEPQTASLRETSHGLYLQLAFYPKATETWFSSNSGVSWRLGARRKASGVIAAGCHHSTVRGVRKRCVITAIVPMLLRFPTSRIQMSAIVTILAQETARSQRAITFSVSTREQVCLADRNRCSPANRRSELPYQPDNWWLSRSSIGAPTGPRSL